jgi:O-acetylserine/cysteine efflux transporter
VGYPPHVRTRDILLVLLGMMIWGVNFAVAKVALAAFPPLLMTALRFALVAIILVPFCARPPRLAPVLGLAATLGGIHFPLLFSGLARVDASTASVVMQLQVPFGALLAALLLDEALGWRRVLGMAIAFAGVVILAGAPRLEANRLGVLMLAGAALIWGVISVQFRQARAAGPLTLNGWIAMLACPLLFAASDWTEGTPWTAIRAAGWEAWAAIAYMALLSTVMGYGLWSWALSRYTVNQVMPYLMTIPVFALLASVAINGDRITADLLAGGATTLTGVAVCCLRRPAEPAASPA